MKVALMVIVIFALTLVIRLWIVVSMEEEGLEAQMTQLDVGHAIKSDMQSSRTCCCHMSHIKMLHLQWVWKQIP